MPRELISKKTRAEFREHFVSYTLREIATEFDAADVSFDAEYNPNLSGERRSLVEQYYHAVDFTDWRHVRRVLTVYEHALLALERRMDETSDPNADWTKNRFLSLKKWIERDGFTYVGGRLVATGRDAFLTEIEDVAKGLDPGALHQQIDRMRLSIADDPALAVGTAKELVETTCRTILDEHGIIVDPNWDLPRLVKEARAILKLLPEDIPDTAKGADTIKKLLGSLGTVAHSLAELRNLYGTGHGRESNRKGVSARHARLAVGAAATLASFLLETHEARAE